MIVKYFQKIKKYSWLADILALAGGIVYLVQSWGYAHILRTMVDEGGYFYIGSLYVRGTYRMFQENGPAVLYMPLSYLVPGQIEAWFGGGLRTGRYFAICLGLFLLVALWIAARRLGGKGWGMAAVWAMALTPMIVQDYSMITSDVLVACMLAWAIVLVTGEKRPLWQIILGSLISGMVVMTRQNMLPVVPILIAYVFWQHGRKAGFWSLAASLLPIVVVTVVYWPKILRLWEIWLPLLRSLRSDYYPSQFAGATPSEVVSVDFWTKVGALLDGFRFNYFTLVGAFTTLLLWPSSKNWKNWHNRRPAFFLAALFWALFILHAWASLWNNFLVFSFAGYLNFFNITALLLVVVSCSAWERKPAWFRLIGIVLFITFLVAGLGQIIFNDSSLLGSFPDVTARDILLGIINFQVPRMRDMHILPGTVPLGMFLANKFGWDYDFIQGLPFDTVYKTITFIVVLLAVIWVALAMIYLFYRLMRGKYLIRTHFGFFALLVILLAGYALSPLLEGEFAEAGYCRDADMLQRYEQIGGRLADLVPVGSQVYWGVDTPTYLLYLPGVDVPPAQLYGRYTRMRGGDPVELLRYGYWNDELADQWLASADFVVLDQDDVALNSLPAMNFELVEVIPTLPCRSEYKLYIYQRIR